MDNVVNCLRYMLFPEWGGMCLSAHLSTTHTGGATLLPAFAVVVVLTLGGDVGGPYAGTKGERYSNYYRSDKYRHGKQDIIIISVLYKPQQLHRVQDMIHIVGYS